MPYTRIQDKIAEGLNKIGISLHPSQIIDRVSVTKHTVTFSYMGDITISPENLEGTQ